MRVDNPPSGQGDACGHPKFEGSVAGIDAPGEDTSMLIHWLRFARVSAVLALLFGGAGPAKADLILNGSSVTVFEGGTGTFTFSVQNTGANIVDFTSLTGSISSSTGDTSDFGSAPFVINTFSVDPGKTVVLPFQVVTGPADAASEPIDFGISGYNLAITAKDRVTGAIIHVAADSFITVNDAPSAIPRTLDPRRGRSCLAGGSRLRSVPSAWKSSHRVSCATSVDMKRGRDVKRGRSELPH